MKILALWILTKKILVITKSLTFKKECKNDEISIYIFIFDNSVKQKIILTRAKNLKRMRLVKLLFICFLAVSTSLTAQDIHFSQFYMAPMNLNPALTGVMNCNIRVSANYRNQWASVMRANAYNTYDIAYDQRIAVGRYDYFGVGATFWGDQAGSLNFGQYQGKVSASYSKRVAGYRDESHYIVFGMEAAFGQRRLDFERAQWGEEHDGEGNWGGRGNSETNLDRNSFLYPDVSAGLMWFSVLNKNTNIFIGGAYHHLNRANITFFDGESTPMYSKFTIHAGGEFMLTNRLGLVPGFLMRMQGPSMEIVPGTTVKFILGNARYTNQSFQLGAWMRMSKKESGGILGDAFILSTRFDYENFTLGFSYDVNTSSLRPASKANGAFEFAIQYKICGPERRNVYCPNF